MTLSYFLAIISRQFLTFEFAIISRDILSQNPEKWCVKIHVTFWTNWVTVCNHVESTKYLTVSIRYLVESTYNFCRKKSLPNIWLNFDQIFGFQISDRNSIRYLVDSTCNFAFMLHICIEKNHVDSTKYLTSFFFTKMNSQIFGRIYMYTNLTITWYHIKKLSKKWRDITWLSNNQIFGRFYIPWLKEILDSFIL